MISWSQVYLITVHSWYEGFRIYGYWEGLVLCLEGFRLRLDLFFQVVVNWLNLEFLPDGLIVRRLCLFLCGVAGLVGMIVQTVLFIFIVIIIGVVFRFLCLIFALRIMK